MNNFRQDYLETSLIYEQMDDIVYGLSNAIDIFFESDDNTESNGDGIISRIKKAIHTLIDAIKNLFSGAKAQKDNAKMKEFANSDQTVEISVTDPDSIKKAYDTACFDIEQGKDAEEVQSKFASIMKKLGIGVAIGGAVAGAVVVATKGPEIINKRKEKMKTKKAYNEYMKLQQNMYEANDKLKHMEDLLDKQSSTYVQFNADDAKKAYKRATGKHILTSKDKQQIAEIQGIMGLTNQYSKSCNFARKKILDDVANAISRGEGGLSEYKNNLVDNIKLRAKNAGGSTQKGMDRYRKNNQKVTSDILNARKDEEISMKATRIANKEKAKNVKRDAKNDIKNINGQHTGLFGKIKGSIADNNEARRRAKEMVNESTEYIKTTSIAECIDELKDL